MTAKYYSLSLRHSENAEYLYFLINDDATNSVSVDVNKACVLFDKPEEKEGFLPVPIALLEALDFDASYFEPGDKVVFNTPENLDKLGLKQEEGVLMPAQQYYVLSTKYTETGDDRLCFFTKNYQDREFVESICKDLEQAWLTTIYEKDGEQPYLYLEKEAVDALAINLNDLRGSGVDNKVENLQKLGLEWNGDLLERVEKKKAEREAEAPKETPVSLLGIGFKAWGLYKDVKKVIDQYKPEPPKTSSNKINDLADKVHQVNKDKGFWDKERNVGEMLMLVSSELGEAMEAHRKGRFADWESYHKNVSVLGPKKAFEIYIKDRFEDEVIDAVLRLYDMAAGLNIDLDKHIQAKLNYNRSRERFHGKKY
jgi:hypothetical protein